MARRLRLLLTVAAVVAPAAFAAAPQQAAPAAQAWGADVNRGAGPKLIDGVDGELRSFVRLDAAARAKKAPELAKKRAMAAIEGWKRFRNPELVELARACLDHDDWHVVHRALHWQVALGDRTALRRALLLHDHAQPLLRERALLATIDLWDDALAREALGHAPLPVIAARRDRERDPWLHAVYDALVARIDGTRPPRVLAAEVRETRKDGLIWTPFLSGASQIATLPVDAPIVPTSDESELSADGGAPTSAVAWPLLQYGREEVANLTLQPFGKPRREGALFHTGVDVGACRDGSGLYALADGIVRLVDSGGTAGTRFVVEFRRDGDGGSLVNAVYMHASARVFVAAGERVARGQLLGTMGDSFSFENGGHFAHLHLGLYPGRYRSGHNHGYQPAEMGLDDWLDPAAVLPAWCGGAPPK